MELTVTLRNADMPQKGVVVLTLPSDDEKLADQLDMIGIPLGPERNCLLEFDASSLLKSLAGQRVNADELNYLAMRLDGMDGYELKQFRAAVAIESLSDIESLINLTFNLSNYTVIDDFSDLSAIGKRYFMDERIAVAKEELEATDVRAIAEDLLGNHQGEVTPFGVVYRHDKVMEIVYTGGTFPAYNHTCDNIMETALIRKGDPENVGRVEWLFLPVSDVTIEKALLRLGVNSVEETRLLHTAPDLSDNSFWDCIDWSKEDIYTANDLSRALSKMDLADVVKLDAVCECYGVTSASMITSLGENLGSFDVCYNVKNAADYGIHCIRKSGEHKYDERLADYYDYKRYGEERMARENGKMFASGYAVFKGSAEELDELLGGEPKQDAGMTMT